MFDYLKKDNFYIANIKIDESINKLRIDLADTKDICFEIVRLNGISKNEMTYINFILYKDKFISCNNDPQIIINKKFKKDDQVSMQLKISILDKDGYFRLFKDSIKDSYEQKSDFTTKIANLDHENQNLKKEISSLLNSYSWKITAPLRKMVSKIKKK